MAKSTKFKDPNLQLVVLGGLWIVGLLKKPKTEPMPAVFQLEGIVDYYPFGTLGKR